MSTGDSLPLSGSANAVRPRVALPYPPTVLWRWRYELAALVAAPLVWWSCARVAGGLAALSAIATLLAVAGLVGPFRRWTVAMAWGVITPHRVRVACAEAGVVSPRGKLPAVLFTRRVSYGERVYLWCPDGLTPEHVGAARRAIAVVCWASEVRVFQTSGQFPPLVALEVVRQAPSAMGGATTEHRAGPSLKSRSARHAGRSSAAPDTRGLVW